MQHKQNFLSIIHWHLWLWKIYWARDAYFFTG